MTSFVPGPRLALPGIGNAAERDRAGFDDQPAVEYMRHHQFVRLARGCLVRELPAVGGRSRPLRAIPDSCTTRPARMPRLTTRPPGRVASRAA